MNSKLDLIIAVRDGLEYGDGRRKSQRRFLDLVVDGTSLWDRLGKHLDMISVLCFDYSLAETLKAVERLLLLSEADLPNERRSLFICSECGDLGCGAITVSATRTENKMIWRDFGYENNYEDRISRDMYCGIGPFEFEWEQYESVLRKGMAQLKDRSIGK